jgi:hypothetical protein
MDAATRRLVRERASQRCEFCRLPDAADEWPFHIDHTFAFVPLKMSVITRSSFETCRLVVWTILSGLLESACYREEIEASENLRLDIRIAGYRCSFRS